MSLEETIPIAIIGVACRLPGGCDSPEKLWDMISTGGSGWCEIPADRWNKDSFYHPDPEAKEAINAKGLYFLKQDITAFDARFFGIHPFEAQSLDPQQRIIMETTYEALENAGIPIESIKGSDTSVHVSVYATDFERMGYKDLAGISKLHMIGSGIAILSNRISYLWDLKGTSATVDTGCSGSMVALHSACLGLRARESRIAIVGGTQLLLTPDQLIAMSSVGLTNPDGRCYVFDSRGHGYARGEGVCSFILKRLDDALEDGDHVHAIIRNSGLNQDGRTAGISLPNPIAQASLMKRVYRTAGLDPRDTGYVEAHGTGTQAGDNAEISSIAEVFTEGNDREELYVGSIKSNIGHLEASSGVAGLMKAILILKHGQIPPNIDFIKPKPSLRLEERRIRIPLELTPLPNNGVRRVSVNSFGYGGTNGHVILEALSGSEFAGGASEKTKAALSSNEHPNGTEAINGNGTTKMPVDSHVSFPPVNGHSKITHSVEMTNGTNGILAGDAMSTKITPGLFVLSARSEASLEEAVKNLHNWVSSQPTDASYFQDLAFTLSTRRTPMQYRTSIAALSHESLLSALGEKPRVTKAATNLNIIFLFTGQGAQWFAMARELIKSQPRFRESILKSDAFLKSLGAAWSLVDELSLPEDISRVGQAEISQPSTTAVQIALVDLLETMDVTPEMVLGHSSGEIAAAYAAGILDHKTALEISYHRGFMSQACKRVISGTGAMIAVGLGEEEVLQYIEKTKRGIVSVACVNSPVSTTVSGDESAIDELKKVLDDLSIFNRKLKIDTAYHSHHMKKVASEYYDSIAHIKASIPKASVKFYSSVTSTLKSTDFLAQYWVDNLVSKVRFSNALDLMCRTELAASGPGIDSPFNVFIEIGPHSALAGPVRQVVKGLEMSKFKWNYLATLVRDKNAYTSVLEMAGKLFEVGYPLSLDSITTTSSEDSPSAIGSLPPYPWDHSTSYWNEPINSKLHRFRAHPPHDLLGLRVPGTTDHEPTWRNLLAMDTLPWLRDHVVDGFVIYPGAGYICIVTEAVRQINIDRKTPGVMSKIHLKNVLFTKAIVIPEKRGDGLALDLEVQLTLRPERNLTDRTWEVFRVLSLTDDVWSEHCSGSVMVEWVPKTDEVEGSREEEETTINLLKKLQSMKEACDTELSATNLYAEFAANGNVFGPSFSNVTGAQIGQTVGVASVLVPDIAAIMPSKYMQPHLLHPASFDATAHLGLPLYKRNSGTGPVMPVCMEEITFDCRMSSAPGTKWTVASSINSHGSRSAIIDTLVFEEKDDGTLLPVLTIKGGELRGIGEATADVETLPFHRKMSYHIKWQPDVDFMTKDDLDDGTEDTESFEVISETVSESEVVSQDENPHLSNSKAIEDEMALYELAATIYIRKCLDAEEFIDQENTKPHLLKLREWMKKYNSSDISKKLLKDISEDELKSILQRSLESGVEGQMLTRIGENLPAILSGTADSLSVMLEDDLLARFYSQGLIVPNYTQMVEYLELLAFKHPHMNILEIGSGTGGATLPLIQSLDRKEGLLFDRFAYTDISAGFFEQGKTLLDKWIDRIDFKTLDISKDPTDQGFVEGTYDLIIASNVLHATSFLDITVANTRKLLKPGGRLILIELTRLTAHINTIFGTLAGWWASEDGRNDCPLLSTDKWDDTLRRQGFNGVESATPDHEGLTARSNMIVAMALDNEGTLPTNFPTVRILCESQSAAHQALAVEISLDLSRLGFPSSLDPWTLGVDLETVYIVLDDAAQPLLVDPTAERFPKVVSLVTKAKKVLWIGCTDDTSELKSPMKGLVTGLARVVRRENEGMRFVTLDVQQSISQDRETLVQSVHRLVSASFPTPSRSENMRSLEDEYSFADDTLLIPRIAADRMFDDWVDRDVFPQKIETGFFLTDRPLKLEVETPGLLNSLRFVDDPAPSNPLGAYELELEARAHGINFKDVFIAMGQMVPGVEMVGECSGFVRKVGSGLTHQYSVGDRVVGTGAAPFCSHPRISGYLACPIPDSMSFAVAASIPIVFSTAYHCIVEVARLQAGQTILIHAASGGVGQAAILLSQHIGAEIFCTVGSPIKKQLLIDTYNIPASHIFSSRLRTFKQGVLRLTKNKGVDVVLNSLSGEWLHDSLAVLAPLGTFVEIGKADIYKKNQISMMPFDRNIIFAAVDLTVLWKLRPEEARIRLGKIITLFERSVLKPVAPITSLAMTDIEEAFRMIQSRQHIGKIVAVCDNETPVKLLSARPKALTLHRDGTYIIAGGLGDLGRRISHFLAAHGAGHIVTLSRRTLTESDELSFTEDLLKIGATLHIMKCDITDSSSMLDVANQCSKLPPVKGIIHGGMVLRDHPFEQMSLQAYMTAVRPKIHGTQNLEAAFGSDSLDFFIMLSSITSILGKTGQANYSVGNAYQDAFAQSKVGSKCRYISLNLGAVDGSEAILSLSAAQQEFMRQGSVLMSFDEVFKVMEYAMGAQASQDQLSQLILGFDRKSMEGVHDEFALANPVFSQIPYADETEGRQEQATMDVTKMLTNATSIDEVHEIVITAIMERFALFTARSLDDINPAASLAEFGLDSLVSIELKNWLVRTFQVSVQTSEVVDAASIASLGKLIASRSSIVSKELGGNSQPAGVSEIEEAGPLVTDHGLYCCRAAKELPKLVLLDLETVFQNYLQREQMFHTAEVFEKLSQDVESFKKPGSVGKLCYDRLLARYQDPEVDNWIESLYLQSVYLQRRGPLAPFQNYMAVHPISRVKHTQSERAALIATVAFKCKQELEAGLWEPPTYMGTPNCTDLWDWLFNSTRVPGYPHDSMVKHAGNDHVAVLHRGHVFKVMLKNAENVVPLESLELIFRSILDREEDKESWIPILTADDRTSWANNRETLIGLSSDNEQYFQVVESSAFLICFDESSPEGANERAQKMVLDKGFNRWNDKSLQFVVCKNSVSGSYVEHTKVDALTVSRLQNALCDAVLAHEPFETPIINLNGHHLMAKEYICSTTPEVERSIVEVRQRFLDDASRHAYEDVFLPQIGKKTLLARGLPIKGVFDLLVQLANFYYYGSNTRTWEAISLSHFHKGRPDLVQTVTPVVTEFCSTADDESIPVATKFESMVAAAHDHNKSIRTGLSGQCYQRTLRALELCVEEGEEIPELFKNPVYEATVEPQFMFTNTDGTSPESIFVMSDPRRFWMTYYVTDELSHFSLVSGKTTVGKFAECLNRAADTMKVIIEAE